MRRWRPLRLADRLLGPPRRLGGRLSPAAHVIPRDGEDERGGAHHNARVGDVEDLEQLDVRHADEVGDVADLRAIYQVPHRPTTDEPEGDAGDSGRFEELAPAPKSQYSEPDHRGHGE